MYVFAEGILDTIEPTRAILNISGLGYEARITLNTYSFLVSKLGERVKLFTHLMIREDAWVLYGFIDESERHMFMELIAISGVGGNTALMILSGLSVNELRKAIQEGDVGTLKKLKGVGEKTAGRILLELKNKLPDFLLQSTQNLPNAIKQNREAEEALAALISLGIPKAQAEKKIEKAIPTLSSPFSAEVLIKAALKH